MPHDWTDAARWLPPVLGVAAGMVARWATDIRHGRIRGWRGLLRRAAVDAPTLVGLTLASAGVSDWVGATPSMAAAIGVGAGYVGIAAAVPLIERKLFGERG